MIITNQTVDFSDTILSDIDLSVSGSTLACDGASITLSGNFAADTTTFNASRVWTLTISGTATAASSVAVAYSNASGGSQVIALGATDNGHNLNWLFAALPVHLIATLVSHPRASAIHVSRPRAGATLIGKPKATATF